jgi:hypothetical protein
MSRWKVDFGDESRLLEHRLAGSSEGAAKNGPPDVAGHDKEKNRASARLGQTGDCPKDEGQNA